MKRILLVSLLALIALCGMAQPNYKFLLQHMPEYSDREALYKLQDYQTWFPKKPHPYYLMGNINYRLQAQEHALVDYTERSKMLYNARVYYGNCRAFLADEHVKADMYPDAVDAKGKVTEESVRAWLTAKLDTVNQLQANLDTLYSSYCMMVNRYDSCIQIYTGFVSNYVRMKDALLMCDTGDIATLQMLKNIAQLLPDDIRRFKAALNVFPIPGYTPEFVARPIVYYRLEGLTTSDFLQNEVPLWDYVRWVDEFMSALAEVEVLRRDMQTEQRRLMVGLEGKPMVSGMAENTLLLNRMDKYDEEATMSAWMHLEYEATQVMAMEHRIVRDSVSEDDWVGCVQLAIRQLQAVKQFETDAMRVEHLLGEKEAAVARKYAAFISTFWPETWAAQAQQEVARRVRESVGRVNSWLVEQTSMPQEVQIDETRLAKITAESVVLETTIIQE